MPQPTSRAPAAPISTHCGVCNAYGVSCGVRGKGRGYYGPRWKIASAGAPSSDALGKLAGLRAAVQRDPTSRPAHRNLVRNAIRAGAPEAFTYATAWSQADPDHSPALLAVVWRPSPGPAVRAAVGHCRRAFAAGP